MNETIISAYKILKFIKNNSYSPWIYSHFKLKIAKMIYELKLKLLIEEKWDHLANPNPYKDYINKKDKVYIFTKSVTDLIEQIEESTEIEQIEEFQILKKFKKIQEINNEIETYINDINLIDNVKKIFSFKKDI